MLRVPTHLGWPADRPKAHEKPDGLARPVRLVSGMNC